MSHLDLISDHSKEKLVVVPSSILDMTNLKMLFLEGNFITKLPEDIFWQLPRLMWLDLRNNLLETLPVSIAHHEKLENLLLTNNNLQKLPNELGTVQNLKALQVSDNPLIYPTRPIIVAGTKAIKNFLKAQYDKEQAKKGSEEDVSDRATELEISISDDDVKENLLEITEEENEEVNERILSSAKIMTRENSKSSRTHKIKKRLSDCQTSIPDLHVKQLLSPKVSKHKQDSDKVKIVHKVGRTGSKLLLKSYLNKTFNDGDNKKFHNLKEGWLNELRILLTDQERILQQERNLRAISNWRQKKQSEEELYPKILQEFKPPYDMDERYIKMPSRDDLAKHYGEINERSYATSNPIKYSRIHVQKMIDNLMDQLKNMQISYGPASPTVQAQQAEMQIRTIMDIQKKLMNLKSINEKTL